ATRVTERHAPPRPGGGKSGGAYPAPSFRRAPDLITPQVRSQRELRSDGLAGCCQQRVGTDVEQDLLLEGEHGDAVRERPDAEHGLARGWVRRRLLQTPRDDAEKQLEHR